MNREAALLGTPCYSIFSSAKGAVDKKLESEGKLVFINSIEDINKIKIEKKDRKWNNGVVGEWNDGKMDNRKLLDFFVNLIESEAIHYDH